jgi:hypothetical protein
MGTKPVLIHLDEELHTALKKAAAERGTSVAALLRDGAGLVLANMYGGELRRSADMKAALAELSGVLAKLQNGHVLVSRGDLPAGSWDDLMREGSTE